LTAEIANGVEIIEVCYGDGALLCCC